MRQLKIVDGTITFAGKQIGFLGKPTDEHLAAAKAIDLDYYGEIHKVVLQVLTEDFPDITMEEQFHAQSVIEKYYV